MESLKSTIFSILILVILGFAFYWAFSNLELGSSHVNNQKLKDLEEQNQKLEKEISNLNSTITILTPKEEEKIEVPVEPVKTVTPAKTPTKTTTTPTSTTTTYKYQTLINELQKLVDENILMKKGSSGTRVGTVQNFLNIYNKTSNRVDNDYGASTETAIKNFQKAQGLTNDGEAGAGTFKKMITLLKAIK